MVVSRIIKFDRSVARTIENYGARSTKSVHLGSGTGKSHAYALHFDAGGEIGEHETGFGQLFVVVDATPAIATALSGFLSTVQ